ncbi:MAG: glycosyltransferase, partial [Mucilaginibacter polytrichastri]|nr:glycosyltransferase [Mucilaginibacter polytrichastri]
MNKPTLSVVTVVYNNVRDVKNTLRSVTTQDYPHIEYLVIDGGSTDGTKEVIEEYG